MEKPNQPVNASSLELKEGEREIIEAELLLGLLETYRFGKDNVPAGLFRAKAAATTPAPDNTTEIEDEVDDDESQGNKSVLESISSPCSNSDPIILLETTVSETGSNEETGYNWLESDSANLPNVEIEREQNAKDGEIEEEDDEKVEEEVEEEEEEEEEEDEDEKEEEEEEKRQRSLSESEEKSTLQKLLATQENYELYCPSCSSCITRKVILKKRKRGKHVNLTADLKSDVPVHEPDEPSDIEEMEPPIKVHVLPQIRLEDDDQEDKEKGIIFTCLACLKYYIQIGARFLQLDYIWGDPVEGPEVTCDEVASQLDETSVDNNNIKTRIPTSYAATEIDQLDPMAENIPMKVSLETVKSINTTQSPPKIQPNRESFAVELLKSTVYGGLTETITSLGVVSSASASGSSTMNILALAVANLAGGLIVLAQNFHDLRNSSDQEKDRYKELLGRRANFRLHILIALLAYIFFGLIPPLVYAFSFYETGVKNYKLVLVFSVSLVCVILLGMIKVYVRKPPNSCESTKSYLKSAAFYTSIVVASSGISYVVGDIMGEYTRKLGWFSLDPVSMTSLFDGTKPEENRFTAF